MTKNAPIQQASDDSQLQIDTAFQEEVAVMTFSGELSAFNVQSARDAVARMASNHKYNLIFDLNNLSYIDSFGIGFIVSVYREMNSCGGDLKLARLSQFVDRIVRGVMNLDFFIPVFDTLEDALAEFRSNAACAIFRWEKVREKRPNYPDAYLNLALIYQRNGLFSEAMGEIGKALSINPSYVDALNVKGQLLLKSGAVEESLACFKKVLEIKPDHLEALTWLAICYDDSNMLEDAIFRYKQVLEIYPKYADLHYRLGMAYLKKGDLEPAVSSLKRALDQNQFYLDAHRALVTAYLRQREKDLAVRHLQAITSVSVDEREVAEARDTIQRLSRNIYPESGPFGKII